MTGISPAAAIVPALPCILVVEDEIMNAMYLEDVLADLGCRAVCVARLAEGLEAVQTQTLAGAFLDISLAGIPVFPLASALRARQVPFAFLTGYDASRLPPEYRDYPLLSKPFAMNQFTRMVATFVAAAAPSVAGVAADSVSA